MRVIKVPAGIGDSVWLIKKLINAGEKFDIQLPDGFPQRGKQIWDLLPQVTNSCEYKSFKFDYVKHHNAQSFYRKWENIKQEDFCLEANTHLENGIRIEEFLPDLPTCFKIDWNTKEFKKDVSKLLNPNGKYIGIYCSAYSTVRHWKFWREDGWLRLVKMINQKDPNYVFVILGASWDIDLGQSLIALLEKEKIPFINTIGNELGFAIEVMKKLHYFFSFPSGLGILANTIDTPTTMFYPGHLKKMMNSWAFPEDIKTGRMKECQFCEPEAIFKWTVEKGWI